MTVAKGSLVPLSVCVTAGRKFREIRNVEVGRQGCKAVAVSLREDQI